MDGSWWERLREVDPRICLLALAVIALGILGFASRQRIAGQPPAGVGMALMLVAGLSIAWRRRAPLVVAGIVGAAVAAASFVGYWPEFAALLWIALYSAAAHRGGRLVPVMVPVVILASIAIIRRGAVDARRRLGRNRGRAHPDLPRPDADRAGHVQPAAAHRPGP